MFIIEAIRSRKVLNSHVNFTNEFVIRLEDGSIGSGGSPKGETISIYEDRKVSIDPRMITQAIERDGILRVPLEQGYFDDYLQQRISIFGLNNVYALSLAFFNAINASRPLLNFFDRPETKMTPPRICCNILNGGRYAYTNPVLSDFPEYLLVSKTNDLEKVIGYHNEIQRLVKERLINQPKTVIAGNPVNCFDTADNRECIDFLLNICESLGLSDKFDLMIDASGGDLWVEGGYGLGITNQARYSSQEFCEYWIDIIKQYNLKFLEDPFYEKDFEAWKYLTMVQGPCNVIGDNFYSSDAKRIEDGAAKKFSNGAVIKPDQAGTVTAVRQAIEAAQRNGQIVITSHRSISTESTFLSTLTCIYGVKYIKIGPLMTDYSSVVRLNEIIRLTEDPK